MTEFPPCPTCGSIVVSLENPPPRFPTTAQPCGCRVEVAVGAGGVPGSMRLLPG